MAVKQVLPGLYQIGLGFVNAYLLDDGGRITLIDTGVPGSETRILAGLAELGKKPSDVGQIVLTHAHGDHTGALASLKRATGAAAWMHPADAALVRQGRAGRPVTPAPGLFNSLVGRMIASRGVMTIAAADIEHELRDGDEVPLAGGLCAIGAPGHCLGQLTFLWPKHGGVLIAADAASNMAGRLSYPPIFEDMAEGVRSLQRLGALDFQVAVFGHGSPIMHGAAERFRQKWPSTR